MKNLYLYSITVLIWGSTWLAIKFQLGEVSPILSIAYRFTLASLLLLGYSWLRKINLRFPFSTHLFFGLQGVLLFSLNYLMVYLAELHTTSGLVAVVFSSLVFMNIFTGALFLGKPIRLEVVVGAIIGIIGIILVFLPELSAFSLKDGGVIGLALGLGGTIIASLGNIVAARNQQKAIPVLQTNAFGMGYGAVLMYLFALIGGVPFHFTGTSAYISSLVYLAVFGSIIAFSAYLTLLGRIGPDRAAYASMLFPLVALGLSSLFEGYQWSSLALAGVLLVLVGNFLVLSRWKRIKLIPESEAAAP